MEPDNAPPPEPAADAAEAPSEHKPSLFASTPVIVALLSLSGVLGGALFSNWDKVFGHAPKTSAEAAPTSLAALHGVWLSPVAQHPYQPQRRFRLRLDLNTLTGELIGRVSDVGEDGSAAQVQEIIAPKRIAEGIDFQVSSHWCCEDGKTRPYETFYQLRPTSQGLAVTRRNNAPGGGVVERFLLARTD